MISLTKLQNLVKEGQVETMIVAFTDHYGRLLGKRVDADYFLNNVVKSGVHGCDYLMTTDMEMEPMPGYDYASWELGYGDFHMVPDMASLRVADWLEKTAIVLCDLHNRESHEAEAISPRIILKRQVEKLKATGFEAAAATELEYYLLQDTYREAFDKHYQDLKSAGYYIEDYQILHGTRNDKFTSAIRRHLKNSGIPVETSKGEWGIGQHEINIKYADVTTMGDYHVLFKQCMKEVADAMGMSVTFMAKFDTDRAGSSSHIHMSLWKDGKNAFVGDEPIGPLSTSPLFRWFLGGWIQHASEMMPFYAPTVNSYKRYIDGSWAPTRLAWSYDNRTAGFRVVGTGENLRIECRIPGADCNPYLALAACIASGMDGIKNKIEPPECFIGDIYAASHLPRVPYTLKEAVALFENSPFVKETFGEEVVKHYAHFYKLEQKAFDIHVTDWERKRYFERI